VDNDTLFDVIIIGLGAMGSSALYHCAKAGLKVLGLERFDHVAHARGSSHGESRITRKAYFEHPSYVPFLQESYTLWHELEALTGSKVLHYTGGLDIGKPASQAITGVLRACTEHNLTHEVLSPEEAHARWPGLTLPPGYVAVYQSEAGILVPEKCIESYYLLAQMAGARARTGCTVHDVRLSADGAEVHVDSEQGMFRAKKIVLAAGPWSTELITGSSLYKHAQFAQSAATLKEYTPFAPASTPTDADATAAATAAAAAATAADPEAAATAESSTAKEKEANAEAAQPADTATATAAGAADAAAKPSVAAAASGAPVEPSVVLPVALQRALDSLVVERQVVSWYRPQPAAAAAGDYEASRFPIFIAHLEDDVEPRSADAPMGATHSGNFYYGFPVFSALDGDGAPSAAAIMAERAARLPGTTTAAVPERGFKLARYNHRYERVADPCSVPRAVTLADLETQRTLIDTLFPGLRATGTAPATGAGAGAAAGSAEAALEAALRASDPDAHGTNGPIPGGPDNHLRSMTCMFTNTPDGHFVIDAFPLVPAPAAAAPAPVADAASAATTAAAAAAPAPVAPLAPPFASSLAAAGPPAADPALSPAEAAAADATASALARLPGLVFVAACAGHGFKFSSAVGRAVADLCAGAARQDLAWLGLRRYEHGVPAP
jgi:glycine/D-amino acid oxidase-like deaminating enzyme